MMETIDDLWHLYNIILPKDKVYARTTREVKRDREYARPKEGKRIPVFLGVDVEDVSWDRDLDRLRVHGIVCDAPDEVSIKGSRHTLNLTVNVSIDIVKSRWPKNLIDRLKKASTKDENPILMVSIDDEEFCIAILREYGLDTIEEDNFRLPGKLEVKKREEAFQNYFTRVLKTIRNVPLNESQKIVVIGPGFVKDNFAKHLRQIAPDVAERIIDIKGVNSAGISGINEALRSGVLTKTLKKMRVIEESKMIEEILSRLGRGKSDVTYGFNEVKQASSYGAIERLVLSDQTIRKSTEDRIRDIERIIKKVEETGGRIDIVSTEHEAGKKLISLGGIGALLRYPLFLHSI
jgi:protein pelota